jgi:hypothetical protein
MCSHPEHRIETLPDGQVDETHVLAHHALVEFLDKVRETGNRPRPKILMCGNGEVIDLGKPWPRPEGERRKAE